MKFSIAIIGGGFAGLSVAHALSTNASGKYSIHIFEKGKPHDTRRCPSGGRGQKCGTCSECAVLTGIGGAATLFGGKLCNYPSGSRLLDRLNTGFNDAFTSSFSDILPPLNATNCTPVPDVSLSVSQLFLKPYQSQVQHTKEMKSIVQRLIDQLKGKVEFHSGEQITEISGNGDGVFLKSNDKNYTFDRVVIAAGRSGTEFSVEQFDRNGVEFTDQSVDIGVRIEFPIPPEMPPPLGLYDLKMKLPRSGSEDIRTFCVCWGGLLTAIPLCGGIVVDGHFGSKPTKFANLAIMRRSKSESTSSLKLASDYTKQFSHGFIASAQSLAEFNKGSEGKALISNRGTIPSFPIAVGKEIEASLLHDIINVWEYFVQLSQLPQSSIDRATIYSPAVDRFWPTVTVSDGGRTTNPNIWVAGDTRGEARGYLQAMWSGYVSGVAMAVEDGIIAKPEWLNEKRAVA